MAKKRYPTAEEIRQAKGNEPIGCTRGPATKAEIAARHKELRAEWASNESYRCYGELRDELGEYGEREKRSEDPLSCMPETPTQLLTNQPRIVDSLDALLKLKAFCKSIAKNEEVTLSEVRDQLANEIDGILKYLVNGLNYSIRAGRPNGRGNSTGGSQDSNLILFKREVGKAIIECRPLVRLASRWPEGSRERRVRMAGEISLRMAGYSNEQIRAYYQATANAHHAHKIPIAKNNRAADRATTVKALERIAVTVAIELVAIRNGLEDSSPVYRAWHQPAYPSKAHDAGTTTMQEIINALKQPRTE